MRSETKKKTNIELWKVKQAQKRRVRKKRLQVTGLHRYRMV